jgi:hypothetical protein
MNPAYSFGYMKLPPGSGATTLGSVMTADPSFIKLTRLLNNTGLQINPVINPPAQNAI